MHLEDLPVPLLILVSLHLSLEKVILLCSKNKSFYARLYSNEDFWQQRYLFDFGVPNKIPSSNSGWREAYSRRRNTRVYAFGKNFQNRFGFGEEREYIASPTLIPLRDIEKISCGGNGVLFISQDGQIHDSNGPVFTDLVPTLPQMKQIAIGGGHTLFLSEEGRVYSFGWGQAGQLGLGDDLDQDVPTLIPFTQDVKMKKIAAGGNSSFIISQSGQVYAFGDNNYGQLGLGDTQMRFVPTLIPDLPKIKKISAGDGYILILSEGGEVLSCGYNFSGQLGLGDYRNRNIPTLISFSENIKIKKVSAGSSHSLLLSEDGKVYSTGANDDGMLGLGKGFFYSSFPNTPIPICIQGLPEIKSISIHHYHSLVLTKNGQVYVFGLNDYGQLGLGTCDDKFGGHFIPTLIPKLKNVIQISTGDNWSVVLTQGED